MGWHFLTSTWNTGVKENWNLPFHKVPFGLVAYTFALFFPFSKQVYLPWRAVAAFRRPHQHATAVGLSHLQIAFFKENAAYFEIYTSARSRLLYSTFAKMIFKRSSARQEMKALRLSSRKISLRLGHHLLQLYLFSSLYWKNNNSW